MKIPINISGIGNIFKGREKAAGTTGGYRDIQINIFREGYRPQGRRLPGIVLITLLAGVSIGGLIWVYQGYADSKHDADQLKSELNRIEQDITRLKSPKKTNTPTVLENDAKAEALKAAQASIRGGSDDIVPIIELLTDPTSGAPTFSSIKFDSKSKSISLEGSVTEASKLITYARAMEADPHFGQANILSLAKPQQAAIITALSKTTNAVVKVSEKVSLAQTDSGPIEIDSSIASPIIEEEKEDKSMIEDQAQSEEIQVGSGPQASFEILTQQPLPNGGIRVVFHDTSTSIDPIVSWEWDFGDGDTSTLQNPIHDYLKQGTFRATLKVKDSKGAFGTSSIGMFDKPKADFTAALVSCADPLTVAFTDQSTSFDSLISWKWDFNADDTVDSTQQNPTYTFPAPGAYEVSLTVEGSLHTPATVKKLIKASTPPSADFSVAPASTANGLLTLKFMDLSTPGTIIVEGQSQPAQLAQWQWDFGDGVMSTEQNPTHTYTRSGRYTVTLRVVENDGNCSTKIKTIEPASGLVADFTAAPYGGRGGGLKIQFTNRSTVTDSSNVSWLWDFGDGTTSTSQSPAHTYAKTGKYTVTLSLTEKLASTDPTVINQAVAAISMEIQVDETVMTPFTMTLTKVES